MTIEMIGDVRGWFHERLTACMAARSLAVADETTFYLVELLASAGLARRESLCGRPLVMILAEASSADDGVERLRLFRTLGDEALYVGGFFADHLERRGVSEAYVSRLGTQAYETASSLASRSSHDAMRVGVYRELAELFAPLTRVLDDVRESTALRTPQDIVRLYDKWRRTGSPRIAARLTAEGVYPGKSSGMVH
ncbi:MAG: hypothetical protein K1X94_32100 [Sandaracinaceae bacterium]|nr:hypothetical protein [Sandaracinaceae bacterium]